MGNFLNLVAQRSLANILSRKIAKITLLIFFVTIVTIAVLTAVSNRRMATEIAQNTYNSTVRDIENILTSVEASTDAMAWILSDDANKYIPFDITKQMVRSDTSIVDCAIAYESGIMVTGNSVVNDGSYLSQEWYRVPKVQRVSYWSDAWIEEPEEDGKTMITTYSVPLIDSLGTFKGIIKSDVELGWLTDKILALKPFKDSYFIVLSKDGTYLMNPIHPEYVYRDIFSIAEETGKDNLAELGKKLMNGESGNEYTAGRFAVYGSLKNGWSMVLLCPAVDLYKESRIINVILLVISLLGLIAIYVGTDKALDRALLPVTEFTYAASIMAKGTFDVKIPEVKSKDEIRRLRDSIVYLQESIRTYIRELRETLTSNERYESELNIASNIQDSMLPKVFIKRKNIDIYATLAPAKEVGGDLYDFYIKDDKLFFAIGDVSGKGVPAALYMAITRAAHRFISAIDVETNQVAFDINNSFADNNDWGMFVTLFVGNIDLKTLKMEYCNAGHNPIIIISPEGSASYLKAKPNIAAGLFENFKYQDESIQIQKGSRLLLYTDGITEAERSDKQQYGESRLLAYASKAPAELDSKTFTDGLIEDVRKFTAGNEQNDDITVMTITL